MIRNLPLIKHVVATMNSLVVSFDKYLNALISAYVQPPIKKTRVIFWSDEPCADCDEFTDVFEFPWKIETNLITSLQVELKMSVFSTSLAYSARQTLLLFDERSLQESEQISVLLPVWLSQILTKSYRKRRVATEHVRYIVRIVLGHVVD